MLITHDRVYEILRKLAKEDYWQTIYSQSKETNGLNLFRNLDNFTMLQVYFINQMSFYSSLYFDIAMGEVSELVLKNEIYEDAYSYFRHEKRMKKARSTSANTPVVNPRDITVENQNQWVFTKVKK